MATPFEELNQEYKNKTGMFRPSSATPSKWDERISNAAKNFLNRLRPATAAPRAPQLQNYQGPIVNPKATDFAKKNWAKTAAPATPQATQLQNNQGPLINPKVPNWVQSEMAKPIMPTGAAPGNAQNRNYQGPLLNGKIKDFHNWLKSPYRPPTTQPAAAATPAASPQLMPVHASQRQPSGPMAMTQTGLPPRRPESAAVGGVPSAGVNTQPGQALVTPPGQAAPNRYLEMARSGPVAQNQAFNEAGLIQTIRGVPGSSTGKADPNAMPSVRYFNPQNPMGGSGPYPGEFSTAVGARTGIDEKTAMAMYGIEAPIAADKEKAIIAASGKSTPETKLITVDTPSGKQLVYDSSTRLFMDPEAPNAEQQRWAESFVTETANMTDDQLKARMRDLTPEERALVAKFFQQYGGGK